MLIQYKSIYPSIQAIAKVITTFLPKLIGKFFSINSSFFTSMPILIEGFKCFLVFPGLIVFFKLARSAGVVVI